MTKVVGISASILRENPKDILRVDNGYIKSIIDAGALPIMIPVLDDFNSVKSIVSEIDALILSGGADVSPFLYDEDPLTEEEFQPERDKSEIGLFIEASKREIPIMGICRGLQLVNVIRGGSLYQDLRLMNFDRVIHNRKEVSDDGPDEMFHFLNIDKDSRFYNYAKSENIIINSIHHQAIKELGDGLKAVAKSRDGIIEVVEMIDYPKFWGFQFHPERLADDIFKRLFDDFLRSIDE